MQKWIKGHVSSWQQVNMWISPLSSRRLSSDLLVSPNTVEVINEANTERTCPKRK